MGEMAGASRRPSVAAWRRVNDCWAVDLADWGVASPKRSSVWETTSSFSWGDLFLADANAAKTSWVEGRMVAFWGVETRELSIIWAAVIGVNWRVIVETNAASFGGRSWPRLLIISLALSERGGGGEVKYAWSSGEGWVVSGIDFKRVTTAWAWDLAAVGEARPTRSKVSATTSSWRWESLVEW